MKITRMFSHENEKGIKNYWQSQKAYEIARTVIYFLISGSLFAAGWITTGKRENLLTIVAVLGCLPACKSAVEMIMFLRYKGCEPDTADKIAVHSEGLNELYDMIFTAYDKNYQVDHLVVKNHMICGYTRTTKFDEQAFYKHIDGILKKDQYKDVTVKVFKDLKKYTERLEQLQQMEEKSQDTPGIIATLKSVSL